MADLRAAGYSGSDGRDFLRLAASAPGWSTPAASPSCSKLEPGSSSGSSATWSRPDPAQQYRSPPHAGWGPVRRARHPCTAAGTELPALRRPTPSGGGPTWPRRRHPMKTYLDYLLERDKRGIRVKAVTGATADVVRELMPTFSEQPGRLWINKLGRLIQERLHDWGYECGRNYDDTLALPVGGASRSCPPTASRTQSVDHAAPRHVVGRPPRRADRAGSGVARVERGHRHRDLRHHRRHLTRLAASRPATAWGDAATGRSCPEAVAPIAPPTDACARRPQTSPSPADGATRCRQQRPRPRGKALVRSPPRPTTSASRPLRGDAGGRRIARPARRCQFQVVFWQVTTVRDRSGAPAGRPATCCCFSSIQTRDREPARLARASVLNERLENTTTVDSTVLT